MPQVEGIGSGALVVYLDCMMPLLGIKMDMLGFAIYFSV